MTAKNNLPKIDLTTFFLSVSSAAYVGLGLVSRRPDGPDGDGKGDAFKVDLELARQNIDLLELMLEKTQGNRSKEEDHLLEQLLFEIRMKYVEKLRESKS
jgi:Domain of unknown function (DUF1844)